MILIVTIVKTNMNFVTIVEILVNWEGDAKYWVISYEVDINK